MSSKLVRDAAPVLVEHSAGVALGGSRYLLLLGHQTSVNHPFQPENGWLRWIFFTNKTLKMKLVCGAAGFPTSLGDAVPGAVILLTHPPAERKEKLYKKTLPQQELPFFGCLFSLSFLCICGMSTERKKKRRKDWLPEGRLIQGTIFCLLVCALDFTILVSFMSCRGIATGGISVVCWQARCTPAGPSLGAEGENWDLESLDQAPRAGPVECWLLWEEK